MSISVQLNVNGKSVTLDCPSNTTLVDLIRGRLELTGTHVGCDTSQCGACTVIIDGVATRSCVTAVSRVSGQITTLEGLAKDGTLDPVQQAWIDEQVPQCGYCQSGQIMAAVALLDSNPAPTDADIDTAMRGNICRCGTYPRIRRGIKRAALALANASGMEDSRHG